MRIVFLDFDGCLNSPKTCDKNRHVYGFEDNPDPELVGRLNEIIATTGALVVISSTWRISCNYMDLWRLLDLLGFKGRVIGQTPELPSDKTRGDEIRQWLDDEKNGKHSYLLENPSGLFHFSMKPRLIESFVIIDDDPEMGTFIDRLVRCDPEVGLSDDNVKEAVEILCKPALLV